MMTYARTVSRQRRSRQRGNVLVEFGAISVVMLLMTLGVVDFGRIYLTANKVANAASAGTSYGALSPAHYTDIEGMKQAALTDLGNVTGAEVLVTQTCRCSLGGAAVTCPANCASPLYPMTYVQVQVTVPFKSLSKLSRVPGLTNVTARSIVRVE
ncbi:MAG: hypothetical protein RL328_263 [Acidobacteriota bacterium]|jgi:Flp pilus assembly protein TadG